MKQESNAWLGHALMAGACSISLHPLRDKWFVGKLSCFNFVEAVVLHVPFLAVLFICLLSCLLACPLFFPCDGLVSGIVRSPDAAFKPTSSQCGKPMLVLDACCLLIDGSWFMVHGSWLMVHGSWLMPYGSWPKQERSRGLGLGHHGP